MNYSVRKLIRLKLRRTQPNVHKGDFGRVFVIAGSRGLTGSCRLASMAALRAGAGLVTVGAPQNLSDVLTRIVKEVMWIALAETREGSVGQNAIGAALKFLKSQDVLAIGPGISRNRSSLAFARSLILNCDKPMVVDADGIAAFWGRANELKKIPGEAVFTPHPGEFRGLYGSCPSGALGRLKATKEAARKSRVVMVLKGHRTVVSDPKGSFYVNKTGNPGMATGGAGDVLTGVIAAFLGQGMSAFEAATAGVYVHGLAGDMAARKTGRVSLVASDILEALPSAMKRIVGN